MATMSAARLHEIGTVFSVDQIERPQPRPNDVLVKVKACGVISLEAYGEPRTWGVLIGYKF